MRIREITVEKLFGLYDYRIPLNLEKRVTIVHAQNGYGKTTVLRLVDAAVEGSFSQLMEIPFRSLELAFEDGSRLRLRKARPEKMPEEIPLTYEFIDPEGELQERHQPKYSWPFELPLGLIENELTNLQSVGPKEWLDTDSGKVLTLEQVIERYGQRLPLLRLARENTWLKKLQEAVHIHFIGADRLTRTGNEGKEVGHRGDRKTIVPAVRVYAQELSRTIEARLAESAAVSQDLDRTFPARLIESMNEDEPLGADEIRRRLEHLEKRRQHLEAVGLLDGSTQVAEINTDVEMTEDTRRVLSLYIEDTEKKLAIFAGLEKRIGLLMASINEMFHNKKLKVDRRQGFVFILPDGRTLPPEKLSSGEQHELLLNYELLFKCNSGSLVLIDEPEISLHIAWQQQYLERLLEIADLTNVDVLLATHSPDIIGGYWDLTVQLGDGDK